MDYFSFGPVILLPFLRCYFFSGTDSDSLFAEIATIQIHLVKLNQLCCFIPTDWILWCLNFLVLKPTQPDVCPRDDPSIHWWRKHQDLFRFRIIVELIFKCLLNIACRYIICSIFLRSRCCVFRADGLPFNQPLRLAFSFGLRARQLPSCIQGQKGSFQKTTPKDASWIPWTHSNNVWSLQFGHPREKYAKVYAAG